MLMAGDRPGRGPVYHHEDSIDAHLTTVFTALAVARDLQARGGSR